MPKLIDMVRDAAPTLGAVLTTAGGPYGAAASAIINGVLGLPQNANADQQADAMAKATPEQLLALKQADNEFALKMRQADSTDLQTDANDRASARARDAAAGADMFNHVVMGCLAAFALLLLMFIVYLVATQPLQDAAKDIMLILVGTIAGLVTQVYNYYFGSSSGSNKKTDSLIGKLTDKKA